MIRPPKRLTASEQRERTHKAIAATVLAAAERAGRKGINMHDILTEDQTGMSRDYIRLVLEEMTDLGIITRSGYGQWTRYFKAPAEEKRA